MVQQLFTNGFYFPVNDFILLAGHLLKEKGTIVNECFQTNIKSLYLTI